VLGDRLLASPSLQAVNNVYASNKIITRKACNYDHVIYAFRSLPECRPTLPFMVDLQCTYRKAASDDAEEVGLRNHLSHVFLVQVMLKNE
jgi:hypothetical protein